MKILAVIDMQNDFLTGTLANPDGVAVIPNIKEEISKLSEDDILIFTRDTHEENYLETQEGRNLPVKHCIRGTDGHAICDELKECVRPEYVIDKPSFGFTKFPEYISVFLREKNLEIKDVENITLVGVCTDICVISNAMILKAAFPETLINVVADACAGVSKESHNTALNAMKACQINIIREEIK